MKIKKIKFSNFRQFENLEINFSDDFNVVIAENTVGKSTLVAGIKFCLYGSKFVIKDGILKDDFNKGDNTILLKTFGSNSNLISVDVTFSFGSENLITMSRSMDVVTKVETTKAISRVGEEEKKASFDRILKRYPLFMSKLAIVDEANISTLTKLFSKDVLNKNFVDQINNLSQADNIKHYIDVTTEALEVIDIRISDLKHNIKTSSAGEDIIIVERKINQVLNKKREVHEVLEFQKRLDLETSSVKIIDNKIKKYVDEINKLEEKLVAYNVIKTTSFINNINSMYTLKLLKDKYNFGKQNEIIDIINDSYNNDINKFNNSGVTKNDTLTSLKEIRYNLEEVFSDQKIITNEENERDIYFLKRNIEQLNEEIVELEKQKVNTSELKNTRLINSQYFEYPVYQLENIKADLIKEHERLIKQKTSIEKIINLKISKENQLSRLVSAKEKLVLAKSEFKAMYNENSMVMQGFMNENINANISYILGNKAEIKIDEFYNPHYKFDNITGRSTGVEIAISISYLIGLLSSINDLINKYEKDLALAQLYYPIILDGAFSQVDHEKSNKITELLTSKSSQVIIFTYEDDYLKIKNSLTSDIKIQKLKKINNITQIVGDING